MSNDLLKVDSVVITASGKPLGSPISFALSHGELVGITGPSGVGKTTLLRTIAGLRDQASGRILLEGRPPEAWGWPEYRRRVVLVSQTPVMLDLTMEENLLHPFTYRSSHETFPETRAKELVEQLGIGVERWEQPAKTLSVGQQQRVSLIRAILLNPAILCMDEPTSALDPESTEQVQRFVTNEAAQRGLSALIVTHSPKQAQEWCDRTVALGSLRKAASTASDQADAGVSA